MKSTPTILLLFIIGCKEPLRHPRGGFAYPQPFKGIDSTFYFYPLKDIESKAVAFGDSYQYLLYRRFKEPNISLQPLEHETLRLTYGDAFGKEAIIVLTNDSITVKQGSAADISYANESLLTELEKEHLYILNKWYPVDTAGKTEKEKKYLDTMVKRYPQLLNVSYYHRIYEKQFVLTGKKFSYSTYKVPVSKKQSDSIFQQIDSSGFWAMPNFVECNASIADGDLFTLEANTRHQYQKVSVQSCPNNKTKYIVACQNLVRMARMDKEINLIWEEPVNTRQK